jgi:hypothetical protein
MGLLRLHVIYKRVNAATGVPPNPIVPNGASSRQICVRPTPRRRLPSLTKDCLVGRTPIMRLLSFGQNRPLVTQSHL